MALTIDVVEIASSVCHGTAPMKFFFRNDLTGAPRLNILNGLNGLRSHGWVNGLND